MPHPPLAGFAAGAGGKVGDEMLGPYGRMAAQAINFRVPNAIPSPGELIEAYVKGRLSWDELQTFVRFSGAFMGPLQPGLQDPTWQPYIDAWGAVAESRFAVPGIQDIISYQLRSEAGLTPIQLPEWQLRRYLRWNGVVRKEDQDLILSLRYEIPGIGDLARFATRETFNVPLSEALLHYDGLPDTIRRYFIATGFGGSLGFQIHRDGLAVPATWADMFWAAHWVPLSPGQAYEMYQRLRPGRVQRYWQEGFTPPAFQFTDLERWLRVNEYPPGVRQQLAAIAYRPLGLRFVQQGVRLEVRDRDWAGEHLLDMGFAPADLDDMLDILVASANPEARNLEKSWKRRTLQQVLETYRVGVIDSEAARLSLIRLGIRTLYAERIIAAEDLQRNLDRVKSAIKAVQKGYFAGTLDAQHAEDSLVLAGISRQRAQEKVSAWKDEWSSRRKTASAGQIVRWVQTGWMPAQEGSERLTRLGWTNADGLLLIAEAQAKLLLHAAKIGAAGITAADLAAADLAKIRQQAQRLVVQAEKALCAKYPLAKLLKWVREGLMSAATFRTRMLSCGYPPDVIELYLAEQQAQAVAAAAKQVDKLRVAEVKARAGEEEALIRAEAKEEIAKTKADAKIRVAQIKAGAPPKAVKAARAKAARLAGPSKLLKWYAMEIIDDVEFTFRLRQLGYDDSEIPDWLAEAERARAKANAPPKAKAVPTAAPPAAPPAAP